MMYVKINLWPVAAKCRTRRSIARHPGHMSYAEWLITVETLIWATHEGYVYDMEFMEQTAQQLWENGETIMGAVRYLLDLWNEMCDEPTVH